MLKYILKVFLLIFSLVVTIFFNPNQDTVEASITISQNELVAPINQESTPPRRIWYVQSFRVYYENYPNRAPYTRNITIFANNHLYSGVVSRPLQLIGKPTYVNYSGWLYLDDGTGPIPTIIDNIH